MTSLPGTQQYTTVPRIQSRALVSVMVLMTSLHVITCEIHPSQAAGGPGVSGHVPAVLSSQQELERLDLFLTELMDCRSVPGLTLSVVVNNQVALTRHYGTADRRTDTPVTKDTVFCVASLSKAFTSVLLAILLDRHGFTWDTTVRQILGDDFRLYDDYVTDHVTIRDLLLHRTGVPRYDLLWFSGKMDKKQLLRHLRCLKPEDDFRSRVIYNNILYMVAGHVTEVLGGKSWEELIKDEILRPLGMNNTAFFHARGDLADRFAKQYDLFGGRQIELDYTKFSKGAEAISPAISLCSTATDMSHWMEFILSKGLYKHGRRLEYTDTMEETLISQVLASDVYYSHIQRPRTPVSLTLNTYGLAWLGGYYRGYPVLSHYGSFPGFFSMMTLLRIYNIGIFTSINGGYQDRTYTINSLIHTYFLDLLLGKQPWIQSGHYQDPHREICYFPDVSYQEYSAISPVNKSISHWRDPDIYAGTFVSPIYTDLTIWTDATSSFSDGSHDVIIRMQYGLVTFILYPKRRLLDMDIFVAIPDHKDWMVASIHVHFLLSNKNNYYVIETVDLPEFNISSGGNEFTRVEPDIGREYTCYDAEVASVTEITSQSHVTDTVTVNVVSTGASYSREHYIAILVIVLYAMITL